MASVRCLDAQGAYVTAAALYATVVKRGVQQYGDSFAPQLRFKLYDTMHGEVTNPQRPSFVAQNPNTCEPQALLKHPFVPKIFNEEQNYSLSTLDDWVKVLDTLEHDWPTYLERWPFTLALCYESRSDYHSELRYLRIRSNRTDQVLSDYNQDRVPDAYHEFHFALAYAQLNQKAMAIYHIRLAKQAETGSGVASDWVASVNQLYHLLGQDHADAVAL